MKQVGLQVLPTRTLYDFDDGHVHVTLTFMTPALPEDLDVLARPLTYLTWEVKSVDGAAHEISIYDSTSGLLSVNAPDQKVEWAREAMGDLTALRVGTVDQTLLQPAGDETRIDWGYAYAAAPASQAKAAIGSSSALAESFVERGKLPGDGRCRDAPRRQRSAAVPGVRLRPGAGRCRARLAAPDGRLRRDLCHQVPGAEAAPYWRRNGATPGDLFRSAERDYAGLVRRCEDVRRELMADLTRAGGERYAQIAALAYRQALAGCGLSADANNQPMLFAKENSSNGCIATVNVIYPAAPSSS